MFANMEALKMLVVNDSLATAEEKHNVLTLLHGDIVPEGNRSREVVSFEEAAVMMGYGSKSAVYAALKHGIIEGFYGGSCGKRASGVVLESIRRAISRGRKA